MQSTDNQFPQLAVAAAVASTVPTVEGNGNAAFDLAMIEDVSEAEIQLKRNGQPIPLWVTMAGPEHHKRKAFAFSKARRMRKALRDGSEPFTDPAEEVSEENELLADCVLGIRSAAGPFWVLGGQQINAGRSSMLALIEDPKRQWLRKALFEAFNSGEAFTKVFASA